MRKNIIWLRNSILLIIVIITSISIFNYKVDSLGLFSNKHYLTDVVKTLLKGNIIGGLQNYDDRLFQRLLIENINYKNDVIAMGSSRTMQLRKHFFLKDNVKFFNHAVSGASLEDYIAIIGAYESIKGYIPSTIVIGIDPWIFNKNNGQNRWKTLSEYYSYEIDKINKSNNRAKNIVNIDKWKQLINYDYTMSNIKFLKKKRRFYIANSIQVDDSLKGIDGSIYHPFNRRNPNPESVKKLALHYIQGSVYSLENFSTLSNLEQFEQFIKYIQRNNVKVVFFLPPYNPIVYKYLMENKKYKMVKIVEQYVRKFAFENKIEIYGSYNPIVNNFTNEDFFDGMHGLDVVYKTIFKRMNFE